MAQEKELDFTEKPSDDDPSLRPDEQVCDKCFMVKAKSTGECGCEEE